MDLGIRGKTAIVCASSKGLGRASALALAQDGVNVVIAARSADVLEATAAEIRAVTGVTVTAVAVDVTTDAGRKALLAACPAPDILINNAAGPPPGDFRDFTLDHWRQAVERNMISPIALVQATVYGMMDRGFGRIVNITSASIKNPIASLELSTGARLGLAGALAIVARKAAARNVTINSVLPGPFDTDRVRAVTRDAATKLGREPQELEAERMAAIPAKRYGSPAELGAMVAFLCSSHAGYITGQNILMDGGGYPGAV